MGKARAQGGRVEDVFERAPRRVDAILDKLMVHACKHCNSAPTVRITDDYVTVECACGCSGPAFDDENTPIAERRIEAIEGWNAIMGPS